MVCAKERSDCTNHDKRHYQVEAIVMRLFYLNTIAYFPFNVIREAFLNNREAFIKLFAKRPFEQPAKQSIRKSAERILNNPLRKFSNKPASRTLINAASRL